jgi:hypothetical protein
MEVFFWGSGVFTALLGLMLLVAFVSEGLEPAYLLFLAGCVFWTFYAASQVL